MKHNSKVYTLAIAKKVQIQWEATHVNNKIITCDNHSQICHNRKRMIK